MNGFGEMGFEGTVRNCRFEISDFRKDEKDTRDGREVESWQGRIFI